MRRIIIYPHFKTLSYSILSLLFAGMAFVASAAGTLKGTVSDAGTGEPVVGAVIRVASVNVLTTTNLEGVYTFNNLSAGEYDIECKYLGYKTLVQHITLSGGTAPQVLDFKMQPLDASPEVTVTGTANKETDLSARHSEKNADNVTNIMSSQTIELLPDITVANTLQRISGISVERNSTGDGQYAIVRGMDKRYNYSLVNGIKIPTPDNKNRYVPLNLFPNDLMERLEVIKALTPSMEADAIGGAINMQLRSAPDYLLIRGTVAGGFSQIALDRPFKTYNTGPLNMKSPDQIYGHDHLADLSEFPKSTLDYKDITSPMNSLANFVVGNRFGADKKFGALVAGSYANTYTGSNSYFFEPSAQPSPDQAPGTPNIYENYRGNSPIFDYIHVRQYYTQQTRMAAHAKLDYQLNNLNNISFYTLYVQTREQQVRTSSDSVLDIQRTGPGSGLVENESRSRLTIQSIYNSTLQGNHILAPGLKLDWSAVYSIAANNQPDYATFTTTAGAYKDSMGNEKNTPWVVKSMSRAWTSNTDQDLAAYLNLTYNLRLAENDLELKVGGMDRHKTRDNYYIKYKMDPKIPNGQQSEKFTTFDEAQFYWAPAGEANGEQINTNTYTATEDVMAGYVQAKYNFFGRLQVLGGARIETTDQNYTELTEPEATFVGKYGSKSYYDILPSLHFKYSIDSRQNLRLSYYASLTRPGFFEITPYSNPGDQFDEVGNPQLKHTTADNFDLRYELFPKGIDQVLAGVFYKNIYNPIEYGFIRNGASAQDLIPLNFGTATNYGFEAVVTKYFGNFGISGNYTYTHSSITTTKLLYYRDTVANSLKTTSVNQTRPLQGQADHIVNLSLIYKDTKHGFDAQVSFVYVGKKIVYVSSYYGLDYWQRPSYQLDLSAEKSFGRHISVYTKLTNLLNTPTVLDIELPNSFRSGRYILPAQDRADAITVQQDFYKPAYFLGVRYKF